MDCFYDANQLPVGQINVEKQPFQYVYNDEIQRKIMETFIMEKKINFDLEQTGQSLQ